MNLTSKAPARPRCRITFRRETKERYEINRNGDAAGMISRIGLLWYWYSFCKDTKANTVKRPASLEECKAEARRILSLPIQNKTA